MQNNHSSHTSQGKFYFKAGQQSKQATSSKRKRSRSRSNSPEHGDKHGPAWQVIGDDSTKHTVV